MILMRTALRPILLAGVAAFCLCSSMAQDLSEYELGKSAFEKNCKACHMTEIKLVGPSLVGISATYPKDEQDAFVAWAKEPGKKDKRLMQMPPMGHVPDETLAAIHTFVLQEAEGREEKSRGRLFPSFKEPARKLPYVMRAFLPDANPTSMAVILNTGVSVCWDPEACRVRYAWVGTKTRLRVRTTVAPLESKPFYRETVLDLGFEPDQAAPQFTGYRILEDGSPEFAYSLGNTEVRERISDGDHPHSFRRTFTFSDSVQRREIRLAQNTAATIAVDKGTLKDGVLSLTGEDTQSFTLTISPR